MSPELSSEDVIAKLENELPAYIAKVKGFKPRIQSIDRRVKELKHRMEERRKREAAIAFDVPDDLSHD